MGAKSVFPLLLVGWGLPSAAPPVAFPAPCVGVNSVGDEEVIVGSWAGWGLAYLLPMSKSVFWPAFFRRSIENSGRNETTQTFTTRGAAVLWGSTYTETDCACPWIRAQVSYGG